MNYQLTPSDVARFWSKVDRKGAADCWKWRACRNPGGYGMFTFRPAGGFRVGRGAHRVSYLLAFGPFQGQGMEVCHRCDTRDCVNPGHLFLGTHWDNMRDMVQKGRSVQRRSAFCIRGHAKAGDNLYLDRQGRPYCRQCKDMTTRAWQGEHRDHEKALRRTRARRKRVELLGEPIDVARPFL